MTTRENAIVMAYIGRAPCGCIRLAVVDRPARVRDTAREVAAAVRSGLSIERHEVDAVRTMPWDNPACTVHPKNAQQVGGQLSFAILAPDWASLEYAS